MMQVLQILTSIYRYCPESSTVVLLDEPDAHLHANMQVALFYSLREIQKELGIQILISTHSTAIISAAMPSEIIPVSNSPHIGPLTKVEEVDDIISERINSYELSKVKSNGVLVFFEDKNIDYFEKCDQVLNCHCLIGHRTVAMLTGRSKDDKLPFHIRPVLQELLGRNISVFVIRDRDGLSDDIVDIVTSIAEGSQINYHFLDCYEVESYLLDAGLIHRTLEVCNPNKDILAIEELENRIILTLKNTLQLARYKYSTVLEDSLSKLSIFDGLEIYRSSNEYRGKAEKIRAHNEAYNGFEDLRRVEMGKEALKEIMQWLNDEMKLKISKKAIISELTEYDIPDEIKKNLHEIQLAIH